MKVLLVEDEVPAGNLLRNLLQKHRPNWQVDALLESVSDTAAWLNAGNDPELIFMDIHLADGISFDIFKQTKVSCPVIFTTAYDQYAIKAFSHNGIAYLLKPIDEDALKVALQRFEENRLSPPLQTKDLSMLLQAIQGKPVWRERFLLPAGDQLKIVPCSEVGWIFSQSGVSTLMLKDGKQYSTDQSLDALEGELNPDQFYRINRHLMVSKAAVKTIRHWFTRRFKLELHPPANQEIIVSRDRVKSFTDWMEK